MAHGNFYNVTKRRYIPRGGDTINNERLRVAKAELVGSQVAFCFKNRGKSEEA